MVRSLEAGHPVTIDIADDFVDGAVVRTPGQPDLRRRRASWCSEIEVVAEGRVCTEQLALYQDDGIVAEPAGALSIAALDALAGHHRGPHRRLRAVGGNNDVARYGEIIERCLVYEGLKHYFVVAFPQQPGASGAFSTSAWVRPTTSSCSST